MVAAEYLRQSVVPLQEHSRPVWMLVNTSDDIWLSNSGPDAAIVDAATRALFGVEGVEKPSGVVRPLYKRKLAGPDPTRDADLQRARPGGRRAASRGGRGRRDARNDEVEEETI